MARNTRLGWIWNTIDRTVRNAVDIRNWPGASTWFLRRGSVSSSTDFDAVDLERREYYVGQLYAAIRTRANRVADLAKEHTKTRLFDDPEAEVDSPHPYLTLINESPSFANTYFWKAMSTFLDLTGTAYIFVLRNSRGKLKGTPKEFKIINPFNLQKVVKESDPGQYRYIETRGTAWREIPEEQMIVVKSFNPFNLADGYAMVEAARDDQFSIQQARAYTRAAVKNNVGQRGMLAPETVLNDEDFANFESAVSGKGNSGKFLTTNAPIRYTDMQIDLKQLALGEINKISIDALIAVTGVSKTLLGVEESGTTRDTSRVQKDLFTENHAQPQLTDILDALNQDYKNSYPTEYQSKRIELYVDSPLKVDKETELKEADIEKRKAETFKILVDAGMDPESTAEYLELDDIEFEERQPLPSPFGQPPKEEDEEEPEDEETQSRKQFLNRFSPGLEQVVAGYEATLTNQVTQIEGQILQAMLPSLSKKFEAKNQVSDEEAQVMSDKDRKRIEAELALAIAAFGIGVISLFGSQTSNRRFAEFALPAEFTMTSDVNKIIKERSKMVAKSHVLTFQKAVYGAAQEAAIEGLGRDAIVSRLTTQFPKLAKTNATRIAHTEAYRAVNMAQYEADKQFLKQNGLEARAYKRWTVQSGNPCPYCKSLDGKEVPFADNFLDLGDSLKAEFDTKQGVTTREMIVGFEPISSGNAHANCYCTYELVIKS